MNKLSIRDIDVRGKRVLVRVDFNVPIDEKTGAITDDSRIKAALPTINMLTGQGGRVILCSHLGRPDGKVVEIFRLTGVAKRLSELIDKPVELTKDCIGAEAEKAANALKNGDVLMLENLRFHAEEEANDPEFSKALAKLADVYVDDAFGTAHRKHASISGVTKYLPSVAGLLLEKELEMLGHVLEKPRRPFCALFGGAKVSDKVTVLDKIIERVNDLLIGGGMCGTFLKAKGLEVGLSLVEDELLVTAIALMKKAADQGAHFVLPIDVIVAKEINEKEKGRIALIDDISADERIVDIGPQTIMAFSDELKRAKTAFWNGPMGIYEIPQFATGTRMMAKVFSDLKATTIVGGGSTAEMIMEMGLANKISFVSTGGGASMNFLGGKKLPGVEALLDKNSPDAAELKKPVK